MNDKEFEQLEKLLAHRYKMLANLQKKYRAETGRNFCQAGIGSYDIPEYCRGCDVYTPPDSPEISVYYKALDLDDGPELYGILVNEHEISDTCYDLLSMRDWESEISEALKKQAEMYVEDNFIENFEIEKLKMGFT